MMDGGIQVYDGEGLAKHLYESRNIALTRVLLDQCLYIFGIIFVSDFRHLIRQARTDHEWVGTLMPGTFIILDWRNPDGGRVIKNPSTSEQVLVWLR